MQLTQFTDFSLRALIFIALRRGSCTISEIANAYQISTHHLTKIIHHLSKLGLVRTQRGRHGGIQLAMAAELIPLKDVILKLEPHFDIVPCFNLQKKSCPIAPECTLKRVLFQAQQAFLQVLENVTLADVLDNPTDLQQLLNISREEAR